MPHTDTSKSQATKPYLLPCFTQVPANYKTKSYFLPCLTQIPANHRQQVVHLAMSHADTSKSQATNRTSCHVSHRYQHITGNKSYFLPCLTQIPGNHRQQIVLLAMPHIDTSKSQATNRTSCHVSHRYQQISGNKTAFLSMPQTHSSQKTATSRTSYHASHRYQQITRSKIVFFTMPHTDTSKSQATNRTSCNASRRYQQISTGKNRTSCHVSHRYQQITGNKSYILPCLRQIPANHMQQSVVLATLHTDTSKSEATNRTSRNASHRYQPIKGNKSGTSKSETTNRTSCHVSHRYQQIIGNKSYFLPCLTQIPENHRQHIVHLAMPNTDRKS